MCSEYKYYKVKENVKKVNNWLNGKKYNSLKENIFFLLRLIGR